MDTPDKDINWDKLLAALEGTNTEPLNEAEKAMLEASGEIRARIALRDKFPVDEGWQRFETARDSRGAKVVRWKPVWKMAAAAAVLAILVTGGMYFLQQRTRHQPVVLAKADLQPSSRPQLLLSNGEKMLLDSGVQTLQYSNGVKVRATDSSIVYLPGNSTAAVNKMDTLVVPRGHKVKVELVDRTIVWVNAESQLVYPTAFTGNNREVSLQGEAFFDVAANAQQPFLVHTTKMEVKVLGTAFNVNTYNTTAIQTTLVSGKVQVGAVILSPGEQSSYNGENNALVKIEVDTRLFTAWKDNNLYFEDATLADITNSLGRSFDYDFKFEDASLAKLSFTLDMQQPTSLQDVLNRIHLTIGDIKFRVQGRVVYISR